MYFFPFCICNPFIEFPPFYFPLSESCARPFKKSSIHVTWLATWKQWLYLFVYVLFSLSSSSLSFLCTMCRRSLLYDNFVCRRESLCVVTVEAAVPILPNKESRGATRKRQKRENLKKREKEIKASHTEYSMWTLNNVLWNALFHKSYVAFSPKSHFSPTWKCAIKKPRKCCFCGTRRRREGKGKIYLTRAWTFSLFRHKRVPVRRGALHGQCDLTSSITFRRSDTFLKTSGLIIRHPMFMYVFFVSILINFYIKGLFYLHFKSGMLKRGKPGGAGCWT